jgi:exopolysaccharide production protein ExoZ
MKSRYSAESSCRDLQTDGHAPFEDFSPPRRKLESIQALRGVGALLVLSRHIAVKHARYSGSGNTLPNLFRVGDGGVDFFFVISGFVIVMASCRQFQKPGAVGSFLYRRAVRIFPLYWFYSLLTLGVFLVAPQWVNRGQNHQVQILHSFLLLPQSILPLVGQAWYLEQEVWFYLIFALLLLAPERLLPRLLLLWGLLVAVGWNICRLQSGLETSAWVLRLTSPIAMDFILGAFIALAIRRGWKRGAFTCVLLGLFLFLAGAVLQDPLEIDGLRLLCYGLPAAFIVYGAVALESRVRFPKWLKSIGDASFSIYLSQILVISAVALLWERLLPSGLVGSIGADLAMLLFALAFGIAGCHFIEKPLHRFFQNWKRRPAPEPSSAQSLPDCG